MSQKFPGGFVTKSPVAPTTSSASGIWTLDQQEQYQKAGTWPQQPPPPYIEDVFSTYLYTGNGSTQTITNGIDLAGKGGLVWTKARTTTSAFTFAHALIDTLRGAGIQICSDRTDANTTQANSLTAFNSNGYTLGADTGQGRVNNSSYGTQTYVGWTFRKQPKFFDVVTWTGNGTAGRAISHALASTPGFIAVKQTSASGQNWKVWHRAVNGGDAFGVLNTTSAFDTTQAKYIWGNNSAYIAPTSTDFTVSNDDGVNANGATYVAYLFAHNAGGFGATETENVISCGSFSTAGSGKMSVAVDLGYEPQYLLIKNSGASENWKVYDTMRGLSYGGYNVLYPNLSNAEDTSGTALVPTATGFDTPNASGPFANFSNYIYIAIRRGPMKTPTDATKVFSPNVYNTAPSSPLTVTTNFPVDLSISTDIQGGQGQVAMDRLRSAEASSLKFLQPNTTGAESSSSGISIQSNTALIDSGFWAGYSYKPVYWNFRRAPSFFDEVCYTGTSDSVGKTVNHNLNVVPELMIVKSRSTTNSWVVYVSSLGNTSGLLLNGTNAVLTGRSDFWDSTTPTSTVFSIGPTLNANTVTWVAYLFATCAGVSKVGSYTGTGALQTINCGFTSGARFILIKRTDNTGDWYTYDSARGISSSSDPYILMNRDLAQVTGTNYVDTDSTGFQVTAAAPAALNASGGTYIYLAIA